MKTGKRERQKQRSAAKRKERARAKAQQAQAEARRWEAWTVAQRADERLDRGEIADAVRDAARAVALNPHDPDIAQLYLAAAERSRDMSEQARALEHITRLVEPDVRLLARLAFLRLQTGNTKGAERAVRRARAALPARMRERKAWRSLIEFVESSLAQPAAAGSPGPGSVEPESAGRGSERGGRRARPKATGPSARGSEAEPPAAPARRSKTAAVAAPAPGSEAEAAAAAQREAARPPDAAAPSFLDVSVEIAGDVDGLEVLGSASFTAPDDAALAALAARLHAAESYDRLFAVERAQGLLPFSHQEDTARRVLSVLLGRALLADEVGLGKTVEAGLILSEYLLRGRADNALVLAPPSLIGQWREELASKFGIETRTTEDLSFRADPDRFWSRSGVVIASLATARSPRHRELVTGKPWDLLIVDEAHALKNATTESWALVSRITSRFLLLLTATPVENRIEELYNLVSLIRPGHLGGRTAFLRRFSDSKMRARESARAELRAQLGEVMVRNTRALSGVRLPPRFARTVLVQPAAGEGELYGHLAAALRALGPGGRTRLLLSVLLQEAGSSPFAVRATLEKVAGNPEASPAVAEALAPAIRVAAQPTTTGKASALLRVLDGAGEPAVVFTRFRGTLEFLAAFLAQAGIAREKVDGNVPAPLRNEAIARIRQHGGVLLASDVGAEGLNLQFCRRIVNFDLPWNPMRIEQRIGRVHRIGQDHPVDVVNLCLAGSIEERILTILDERINLFELVVGEAGVILGYLEEDREFPDLMLDAFADPDGQRREQSFTRIGDALAAARTRYDNVKRFDEEFFRNELGV